MLQDGHPPLLFASSAVGDGHAVEYVADEVGTAWRRLACSAGQIKAVRGETFAAAGEFELVLGYRSFLTMEKSPSEAVTTSKSLR